MTKHAPLADGKLVALVPTLDVEAARSFYGDTLGLPLISEDGFALVYDAGGTPLRVTRVAEFTPAPFTVVGWMIADIASTVRALAAAGVDFARIPGMEQDELGIWQAPAPQPGKGARVAWFKDPDGNTLSLTQLS